MERDLASFFKGKNLSDDQIRQYAAEILSVAALNIVGAAEDELSEEKKNELMTFLVKKDVAGALDFACSQFSPEKWELLVQREMTPIIDSYSKKVLSE